MSKPGSDQPVADPGKEDDPPPLYDPDPGNPTDSGHHRWILHPDPIEWLRAERPAIFDEMQAERPDILQDRPNLRATRTQPPDWSEPFEIHTHVTNLAITVVLGQQIGGRKQVVRYASRNLTNTERREGVFEWECLAAIWATEVFQEYVRDRVTSISTDFKAL